MTAKAKAGVRVTAKSPAGERPADHSYPAATAAADTGRGAAGSANKDATGGGRSHGTPSRPAGGRSHTSQAGVTAGRSHERQPGLPRTRQAKGEKRPTKPPAGQMEAAVSAGSVGQPSAQTAPRGKRAAAGSHRSAAEWNTVQGHTAPARKRAAPTTSKPQASHRDNLQQVADQYDHAIQGYADHYLGQQGLSPAYSPGGYRAGYAGYAGYPDGQEYGAYGAEWTTQGDALSLEERLQQLEEVAGYFHAALPYIRSLKGNEKKQYLASWREYLTEVASLAAELTDALQKELAVLSGTDTQQ